MTDSEFNELHAKRDALALSKISLMGELTSIKTRLAVRLPQKEYLSVIKKRDGIVQTMQRLDEDLTETKRLIRLHNMHVEAEKRNGSSASEHQLDSGAVKSLVALRSEYQNFAADKTRVGSMRQMAAEFALKLDPIIKAACSPNPLTTCR